MSELQDFNAEALLAAQQARRTGLTQQHIARAVGASQSQVSRVLSGRSRRRSNLLDKVCKYVLTARSTKQVRPDRSPELMEALKSVWDGTPKHAQVLALVIRSLGELVNHLDESTSARLRRPR